jgi:hypothetical protein
MRTGRAEPAQPAAPPHEEAALAPVSADALHVARRQPSLQRLRHQQQTPTRAETHVCWIASNELPIEWNSETRRDIGPCEDQAEIKYGAERGQIERPVD